MLRPDDRHPLAPALRKEIHISGEAILQASTTCGKPALLRVNDDAGFGSTKSQRNTGVAGELSFLFWRVAVSGFRPPK